MDPSRFDRLTRAVGGRTTRRTAVAAALIGMLGGRIAAGPAAAATCRALRQACSRDAQCCSGLCASDAANRRQRNRCAVGCLQLNETGCRLAGKSCCSGLVCSGPASGMCRVVPT